MFFFPALPRISWMQRWLLALLLVWVGSLNAHIAPREVVFIDTGVADWPVLREGVKPGVEVVLLDGKSDGLAQMAAWTAGKSGYDAIHVISHGTPGTVHLGAFSLNRETLDERAGEWAAIGAALKEDGDLLLYGCNVAVEQTGVDFVQRLAQVTGADVAASDDLTGANWLGGDWELENRIGIVDSNLVEGGVAYAGVLTSSKVTIWAPDLGFNPTPGISWGPGYTDSSQYYPTVTSYFNAMVTFYQGQSADVTSITSGHLASNSLTDQDLLIAVLPTEAYTATDITYMLSFLQTGARIVFIGENDDWVRTLDGYISSAVTQLGGSISVATSDVISGGSESTSNINTSSSLAAGVSYFYINAAGKLIYTGAVEIVATASDSNPIIVDQAVGKGRILVMTDINTLDPVIDPSSYPTDDNETFFANLVTTSIANKAIVSSGGNPNAGLGGSPTATVTAANITATTSSYSFTITYSGQSAIDQTTIGTSDVKIVGSNSTEYSATAFSIGTVANSGKDVTVTYTFGAVGSPGSDGWDGADNGAYSVKIVNAEVADTGGKQTGGDSNAKTFNVSIVSVDTTSTVTASATLTEPSTFATTATTLGTATPLLDFTITDVGTADGVATTVTALTVDVSGTTTDAERGLMVFLLNGSDASNVTGTYNAATDKITFSGLNISVANAANETYTVSAYYNDNSSTNDIVDGHTLILSVDANDNFTTGTGSSTFAAGQSAVTNSTGAAVGITATKLVYSTSPSSVTSGVVFGTQPILQAVDARGNVDTDSIANVSLTEDGSGALGGTTTVAAVAGVATFSNVRYNAASDADANFTLTAASGGLTAATASGINPDVVATKLVFTTQPAPTSITSGGSTSFSTVPVVSATDADNLLDTDYTIAVVLSVVKSDGGAVPGTVNSLTGTGDTDGTGTTVTLAATSGAATFTGLAVQYTNSAASDSLALKATSGALTAAQSSTITSTSNAAPTVGGVTATTTINDTATTTPFSGVTIADGENDNVTVTVTLDTAAKGVFTAASLTASGFTSGGVYSLASTTPALAQAAIRQLVFDPTDNRVAPTSTEMTTFTIAVNDGANTTTNNSTTVTATSVNDAPTAIAPTSGSVSTYDAANFAVASLTSTDPDTSDTHTYLIQSITLGGNPQTNDNSLFNISSASLQATTPSGLTAGVYTVTVRTADVGGLFVDQAITITVSDALIVTTNNDTGADATTGGSYAAELADGGGLSLREALALAAAGNKSIGFAAVLSGQTITLGSSVDVPAGTTFDADAVATLTIASSTLNLLGNLTVSNGGGDTLTISSAITGSGSLIKTGAGTLILSGANSYTGTTTINGGTLSITENTAAGTKNLGNSTALLTLDGGTLEVTAIGKTINNAITIGSNGGTVSHTTGNLFLAGQITAASGTNLTQSAGAATLVLGLTNASNSTTFAGTLTVAKGIVEAKAAGNLNTGMIILNGSAGSGLQFTGTNPTTFSLANTIRLDQTARMSLNSGNAITLTGDISGTGGLTKQASGTLTLSGSNTYSGITTISAGTLVASGGSAIGDSGAVTVTVTGTLQLSNNETIGALSGAGTVTLDTNTLTVSQSTNTTFSGAIGGSGGLTKSGTGTLTLTGANTYTGTTTVSAGGLTVNNGSAFVDGSAVTVDSGTTLTLSAPETIGSLAGAGNVDLGSFTLTVGGDGSSTTFSGDLNGSGTLVKTGTGTLTLSGTNTYSGGTTVSAGTLLVTGALGSGAVSVASGATLGGTGSITTGNLTVSSGATLAVDINGITAGTQYDQLDVTGTVNVNSATLAFTLGFTPTAGNSFVLINNDGADAITGTFSTVTVGGTPVTVISNRFTTGGLTYEISDSGGTGNDLTLTVVDLPINGSCGGANGQTFSSAPTSGFCTTGTASALSGSGPWSWTCTGSGGGSTANCSAQLSGGGGGGEVTDDGDGITDATENGAPNSGDGNGDGVTDSQQGNVTSLPVAGGSGSYLTMQTPTGTRLANVTVQTPGQVGVSGNYPWGVLSFEAFGPSPVTITLYLPGRSSVAGLVLNKIAGGQTQALNAAFSIVQIGGQPTVAVSYSLSDNGPHDTCPASGQICDPVGVAEVTDPPESPVTLSVTRTGSGTVSSVPAGITCGSDCSENYPANTAVTLTATAASGYGFSGWSGGCAGTAPTCTLTLSAHQTVTATFNATAPSLLTVVKTGSGTVSSVPAGITCGSDCSESYPANTAVTLSATAASGYGFSGWSGGCAGTAPTCTLTLSANQTVTAMFSSLAPPRAAIGVLRNGQWSLDANGNSAWDQCGSDGCDAFGQAGDMPVVGHWDGGDRTLLGVLRSGTAQWFLDRNGNGQWDDCGADPCLTFGDIGDLPVAADWNRDGKAKIGVFRAGNWYLDANGNGQWDGCEIDRCYLKVPDQGAPGFGLSGDLPIAGDWTGDGIAKVGVFRAGNWYFDNGNGDWDGCEIDRCYLKNPEQPSAGFGLAGDYPIVGDWNSDGMMKIGVFRNGSWFFDNGNGQWDGCGIDTCILRIPEQPNSGFGLPGDLPAVGRW